MLETASYKHQLSLRQTGEPLFMLPYQMVVEGQTVFADEITADAGRVEARFGDSAINDTFTFEAGRVAVRRTWRLEGYFNARLGFSVLRRAAPKLVAAPGALYSGETSGGFDTGEIEEGRCTVPCFLFIEDDSRYFAVFAQPGGGAAGAASVRGYVSGPFAEASIITPGERGKPERAFLKGGAAPGIVVNGHLSVERTFYILFGQAGEGALRRALELAWELAAFEPAPPLSWSAAAAPCMNVLLDRFFMERGDSVGFVKGLSGRMFPVKAALSGGGPGGNVSAARAFYHIAKPDDNHELKRRALDIADFFLSGVTRIPNAICTEYRLGARRWRRPGRGAATVRDEGYLFYDYLLLHRDCRKDSDHNTRWMSACRRWADMAVSDMKPDGALSPYPDGGAFPRDERRRAEPSDAYKIWTLAALAKYFPGAGYRAGAERLATRLMPLCSEYAWGAPGGPPGRDDTLAMLRAFLLMHTLTGHREYLNAADAIATLLLSYTYCYNVRLPEKSALAKADFRTSGAVVDFPGSRALDIFPIAASLELLRLDAALGGGFWKKPALAQLEFAYRLLSPDFPALSPWPGCPPARISLADGASAALESAAPITALSCLLDIADEFPETVKVELKQWTKFRSIKKSLGRIALYSGSLINRWS